MFALLYHKFLSIERRYLEIFAFLRKIESDNYKNHRCGGFIETTLPATLRHIGGFIETAEVLLIAYLTRTTLKNRRLAPVVLQTGFSSEGDPTTTAW